MCVLNLYVFLANMRVLFLLQGLDSIKFEDDVEHTYTTVSLVSGKLLTFDI